MDAISNAIGHKITYTPIDADYLVDSDEIRPTLTRAKSDSELYRAGMQWHHDINGSAHTEHSTRLDQSTARQTDSLKAPPQSASRSGFRQYLAKTFSHPIGGSIVPALQTGAHRLLTAPAQMASATLKGVGSLVGGKTQTHFSDGADQINTFADSAATKTLDAAAKVVAPENLLQAACLTAGNLYGSPMSGVALLSAVQAAQGEPINATLIASNAVQAYSTGVSDKISTALGAGIVGAIASGAATSAISATATAAVSALNTKTTPNPNATAKTILSATVRGGVSAGMEKAVNTHLAKDASTDPAHVTAGKQAVRKGVLDATNTLTENADNQLNTTGQLDRSKLMTSAGQALGRSVAKSLANSAINGTNSKTSPKSGLDS